MNNTRIIVGEKSGFTNVTFKENIMTDLIAPPHEDIALEFDRLYHRMKVIVRRAQEIVESDERERINMGSEHE